MMKKNSFQLNMCVFVCGKNVAIYSIELKKPTAIHDHRLLMAHDHFNISCIHAKHIKYILCKIQLAHVNNHYIWPIGANAYRPQINFISVLIFLILFFFFSSFYSHQLQLRLHSATSFTWSIDVDLKIYRSRISIEHAQYIQHPYHCRAESDLYCIQLCQQNMPLNAFSRNMTLIGVGTTWK